MVSAHQINYLYACFRKKCKFTKYFYNLFFIYKYFNDFSIYNYMYIHKYINYSYLYHYIVKPKFKYAIYLYVFM